jgi:hypothetical protein
MIILKETLKDRPNLKVILMSATLDAEVFASYFNGAPVVVIPGRTFPVTEHFLEDMIELTGYEPEYTRTIPKNEDTKAKLDEIKRLATAAGDKSYSGDVLQAVYNFDEDKIDLHLIEAMIWHIYEEMPQGGVSDIIAHSLPSLSIVLVIRSLYPYCTLCVAHCTVCNRNNRYWCSCLVYMKSPNYRICYVRPYANMKWMINVSWLYHYMVHYPHPIKPKCSNGSISFNSGTSLLYHHSSLYIAV